jgi:MinD superfamily P-loop ATPase
LAAEVVKKLNIPCGIVINRAGVGDEKVEEYCLKEGTPILLNIPLDTEIAILYSKGIPLVEGIPSWKESFVELLQGIKLKLGVISR